MRSMKKRIDMTNGISQFGFTRHLRVYVLALAVALLVACEGLQSTTRVLESDDDAVRFIAQAIELEEKGELAAALAAYTLAATEDPAATDAHMGIGRIHQERGDYEQASTAYEKAVLTDPSRYDAYFSLGLVRQLLGRVNAAISAYLRALTIEPDHFESNRGVASAYLQLNQPEAALPYARRAVELDGSDQQAWANLGATYISLGRFEAAVQAYRAALDRGEPQEPVLIGLADAHIRLENYELAINTLQSAVRLIPSTGTHERLAFTYFRTKRYVEAEEQYRLSLAFDESNTRSLNGLGATLLTSYIRGGKVDLELRDQGLSAWRDSLRLNRNQPKISNLLQRYGQ